MLNFLCNTLNPGILWRHNHIRALSTCNASIYQRVGEKEATLAHQHHFIFIYQLENYVTYITGDTVLHIAVQ